MSELLDTDNQIPVEPETKHEHSDECVEQVERLIGEARSFQLQWQYDLAEQAYSKARDILERKYGSGHISTIRCGMSLALLQQIQGKDAQAEKVYLQLVTKLDLGDEAHYGDAVQILDTLSEMYEEQNRQIDMATVKQKLLEIKKLMLGDEHAEVGQILSELAAIYEILDFAGKEERCLREAFTILRKALGPSNERTMSCLKRLVAVQEKLRRQRELSQENVEWQG